MERRPKEASLRKSFDDNKTCLINETLVRKAFVFVVKAETTSNAFYEKNIHPRTLQHAGKCLTKILFLLLTKHFQEETWPWNVHKSSREIADSAQQTVNNKHIICLLLTVC